MITSQVLDAVPGLTYRMLDHWIRCGYVPDVPFVKHGSGNPREIPRQAIPFLRMMVALTTGLGVRAANAVPLAVTLATEGRAITDTFILIAKRSPREQDSST